MALFGESFGGVWAFFSVALLLGFIGGGPLSDQSWVSGLSLLFSVPIGIVGLIGGSVPLFAPLAILGVMVLFNAYKQSFGVPFYALGLGLLVVTTLGA
ncbi:hypothetical protein HYV43_01705 [Candidatus Micrarchaeota archaeon]|nr:hypothetical protein [Candidatus Micrarchaeota archaeon]